MNKKLFVGGLPYKVTDERLEEVFAVHGTVDSARVVTDKYTGESRGFGFVEMSTPAEAQTASEGPQRDRTRRTPDYRRSGASAGRNVRAG